MTGSICSQFVSFSSSGYLCVESDPIIKSSPVHKSCISLNLVSVTVCEESGGDAKKVRNL